ncbi:hypothetical protein [Rheinheimera fenheensis]|uniref:hypothetical protein n=1 Tax=Rheinheimera fenheensis TaxID=3152295 RepID=UPI00325DC05C
MKLLLTISMSLILAIALYLGGYKYHEFEVNRLASSIQAGTNVDDIVKQVTNTKRVGSRVVKIDDDELLLEGVTGIVEIHSLIFDADISCALNVNEQVYTGGWSCIAASPILALF